MRSIHVQLTERDYERLQVAYRASGATHRAAWIVERLTADPRPRRKAASKTRRPADNNTEQST